MYSSVASRYPSPVFPTPDSPTSTTFAVAYRFTGAAGAPSNPSTSSSYRLAPPSVPTEHSKGSDG